MSAADPIGSVTPRKPVRPARGAGATASSSNVPTGPESRYASARSGHAQRASLSNITLDIERTPRKAAVDAPPLISETSQSRIGTGERSTSGGSKGSSGSSRATVGVGGRVRSAQSGSTEVGTSSSTTATPPTSAADRAAARRSLVLHSSSARSPVSPALRSAPLGSDRKRAVPSGDDDGFEADMSNDNSMTRDDTFDADVSTGSSLTDRERRRRSAMHAQEVHVLRSESRLGSRQGYRDDEDEEAGDCTWEVSDESESSQLRRRPDGTYGRDNSLSGTRRGSLYHEDDDLIPSTGDASVIEQHRFPQRPPHLRQDTADSSGTGGGTGTDTSGTEGAGEYSGGRGGHSRTASRSLRNGDGHTSGSSGITASTSGKNRRRRKNSAATNNHQRRDSGAMRPSTSFENRQGSSSTRPMDEFDQPHWQGVGARARRISLTQQQQHRSRIRSAESDVTAVRETPEPADLHPPRSTLSSRRSPLPGQRRDTSARLP